MLVIRRGAGTHMPGYWAPLSGKMEPGESQEDTLVREVREEVGLEVTPLAKVWESVTDDQVFRLHWWTADPGTAEVVPDPREVGEARWLTPEEFLTMSPLFAADREFFRHVLPGL